MLKLKSFRLHLPSALGFPQRTLFSSACPSHVTGTLHQLGNRYFPFSIFQSSSFVRFSSSSTSSTSFHSSPPPPPPPPPTSPIVLSPVRFLRPFYLLIHPDSFPSPPPLPTDIDMAIASYKDINTDSLSRLNAMIDYQKALQKKFLAKNYSENQENNSSPNITFPFSSPIHSLSFFAPKDKIWRNKRKNTNYENVQIDEDELEYEKDDGEPYVEIKLSIDFSSSLSSASTLSSSSPSSALLPSLTHLLLLDRFLYSLLCKFFIPLPPAIISQWKSRWTQWEKIEMNRMKKESSALIGNIVDVSVSNDWEWMINFNKKTENKIRKMNKKSQNTSMVNEEIPVGWGEGEAVGPSMSSSSSSDLVISYDDPFATPSPSSSSLTQLDYLRGQGVLSPYENENLNFQFAMENDVAIDQQIEELVLLMLQRRMISFQEGGRGGLGKRKMLDKEEKDNHTNMKNTKGKNKKKQSSLQNNNHNNDKKKDVTLSSYLQSQYSDDDRDIVLRLLECLTLPVSILSLRHWMGITIEFRTFPPKFDFTPSQWILPKRFTVEEFEIFLYIWLEENGYSDILEGKEKDEGQGEGERKEIEEGEGEGEDGEQKKIGDGNPYSSSMSSPSSSSSTSSSSSSVPSPSSTPLSPVNTMISLQRNLSFTPFINEIKSLAKSKDKNNKNALGTEDEEDDDEGDKNAEDGSESDLPIERFDTLKGEVYEKERKMTMNEWGKWEYTYEEHKDNGRGNDVPQRREYGSKRGNRNARQNPNGNQKYQNKMMGNARKSSNSRKK